LTERALDAFDQRRWRVARRLFERAGQERRAGADYHLGVLYWHGLGGPRDAKAAVACFARASQANHVAAQTAYGVALRSGVGTAKDNEAAIGWFRTAAAAGDCEAMLQWASMCEPRQALPLLERAAALGHAPAIVHLADAVMKSDAVAALSWLYTGVALTGDEAALARAQKLAREMTGDEIAAAQQTGRARAKIVKARIEGRS
jgi:TPR repeat protein